MNWFTEPILNQYADFEGRTDRKSFWMYILFYIVFAIIVGIIGSVIGTEVLNMVYSLGLLVPSLAITARRLHDINKSGWWQLVGLIPVLGVIILIILTIKEGDAGDNQYGPSPKIRGVQVEPAGQPAVDQVPQGSPETKAPEDNQQ